MSYLKFKGRTLFDGFRFLPENSVLIIKQDGTIKEIVTEENAGEGIQHFDGILTPGLINCHCHLELSHLKNSIPTHTGLIEFLCAVVSKRNFAPQEIQEEIEKAEKEMYENGIVAVGDIGNTADTALIKMQSKIYWHNFVEVLSFTDDKADENIRHYTTVAKKLDAALTSANISHRTSIVPHAPYSISPRTFRLINQLTKDQTISIHNQENDAENELYKSGSGDYIRFFKIFGFNTSPFPITGKSSIQSILPHFNNGQTIFLIHNTSMSEEDIIWANEYATTNGLKLIYCLCINANLYIENKVPPVDIFMKHNCHIVLGTDSYSSNWQLSITNEMATFKKHFPHISNETVLLWATGNGATALSIDSHLGFLKPGTKPGIIQIENDFQYSKRIL